MSRCAIYARFSTDRQSETSAEDQIRECRARADREGWTVVEVYTDLAISGANNRRPGMTAMLADAASGNFDIVLSEALDRIARDQADIATIYKRLTFASVRIETLSEGAVNELHIGLKGTMGALFLKDLADKIRRGQRGTVARGRAAGGLCYGYDVVRELDEHGQLVPGRRRINEEQAAVVRRIITDYVANRSPRSIVRDLNAEGIPAPRGGEWGLSSILGNRARQIGILHNPIYVGRMVYNRVRMVRDPETRNRLSRPNASTDVQSVDVPELRIVSDELWQAAQEARQVRASVPLGARRRPKHLLSGLARCGVCGGSMSVIADTRLGCVRARDRATCTNRSRIRTGELQSRVLAGLRDRLLSPEAESLLVREYHRDREQRDRAIVRARQALARRLQQAEAAVERLVGAIAEGADDFADVRAALGKRIAERDALRAEVGEDEAVGVIALHPQILTAYRARVDALVAALESGEPVSDEVRAELRALVDRVDVTPRAEGDGHTVSLVGSLESALHTASGSIQRRAPLATTLVAEEGLEPPTPGL